MISAASSLFQGAKLLTRTELRPFVLMPIFINVILYSVALILGYFYLNHLVAKLIPDWLHFLTWLIYPLFFISFCVIGFFTFSLLANLIAAPFYAKLAAKTLVVIGAPVSEIAAQSAKAVWIAELKRLRYSLTHTLPLLILFVIPMVNLIAPVLWFGFSAWCVALEFFGYAQENRGVLFMQQQTQLKTMKLHALSFGGLVTLGQSLPILNIVIAPAAVIAATLHLHNAASESA
jgi:CysZ protein